MNPRDAFSAVTHPTPYPYYTHLLAGPPLVFDEHLRMWLASRANVIKEVLSHPHCKVRPLTEPVPKAIVHSPAGTVFGHLVRMNDGSNHDRPKLALQHALAALDLRLVQERTHDLATQLARTYDVQDPTQLSSWMVDVPVCAVADLLGFATNELPQIARWLADFVACLSPLSTEHQLAAASAAAHALLKQFRKMLQTTQLPSTSLVQRVQNEALAVGWDSVDALAANLIGLLSQTYEATAGLLGNSIVALLNRPSLYEVLRAAPHNTSPLVHEVSRFDPSVQNTRRFVVQTTSVAGSVVQAGDVILVLFAAANRDPAENVQPAEFLLDRPERRVFGFGHGHHACPGQNLAYTIATAALHTFLARPHSVERTHIRWTYRPSVNARIPLFSDDSDPQKAGVL